MSSAVAQLTPEKPVGAPRRRVRYPEMGSPERKGVRHALESTAVPVAFHKLSTALVWVFLGD